MPGITQLENPSGAYGQTARQATNIVMYVTNNSGGTLRTGDVVVLAAGGLLATTTTTASDTTVCGVVGPSSGNTDSSDTYAAGATNMPVVIYGFARVNIAANTVAAGAAVASSTAAKVAAVPATAGSVGALQALVGSFIGIPLESQAAKDSNNTIRIFVSKM